MSTALARQLDAIMDSFQVNNRELAELLKATPSTVSRWRSGEASPSADRLKPVLALNYVAEQMAQYYEPDDARMWLYRPNAQLKGSKTPAEMIEEGRTDEVLRLIERIAAGAYA